MLEASEHLEAVDAFAEQHYKVEIGYVAFVVVGEIKTFQLCSGLVQRVSVLCHVGDYHGGLDAYDAGIGSHRRHVLDALYLHEHYQNKAVATMLIM